MLCVRFILFAIFACFLTACVIQPLHQLQARASMSTSQIALPIPNSRLQQLFNQSFLRQAGHPIKSPPYHLDITLTETDQTTLSSAGEASNLNNMVMEARYNVIETDTGKNLHKGYIKVSGISGAVASYFAQSTSKQFAAERLVQLLAERVHHRLQLFFITTAAQDAPPENSLPQNPPPENALL